MGKRRLIFVVLCVLLVAGSAPAAPGDIRTIAGGGIGDGGPAKPAILSTPWALQLAPDGSLLVADLANNRIRRITPGTDGVHNGDPSETISTIAGNGENRSAGDGGPASASSMYFPHDLAFDPAGNLWVVTDITAARLNDDARYTGFRNNGMFFVPTSGPGAGVALQFASAPCESELAGPSWTPARDTMFLSVQHPGEGYGIRGAGVAAPRGSNWPGGRANDPPLPAVVAIRQ